MSLLFTTPAKVARPWRIMFRITNRALPKVIRDVSESCCCNLPLTSRFGAFKRWSADTCERCGAQHGSSWLFIQSKARLCMNGCARYLACLCCVTAINERLVFQAARLGRSERLKGTIAANSAPYIAWVCRYARKPTSFSSRKHTN